MTERTTLQVAFDAAEAQFKMMPSSNVWDIARAVHRQFEAAGLLRDPVKEADSQWSREQVQRVLYTVVASYDQAHAELGSDREFLRDAIRIGRQMLIDNEWWPGSGVSTTGAET